VFLSPNNKQQSWRASLGSNGIDFSNPQVLRLLNFVIAPPSLQAKGKAKRQPLDLIVFLSSVIDKEHNDVLYSV
jgi:hypothetical protein